MLDWNTSLCDGFDITGCNNFLFLLKRLKFL